MDKYNPNIHNRRSIRLKGYDYTQAGLYFVTICVQNRACLLGEIYNNEMILNDAGQMIQSEWLKLPNRFSNIELHEYIIMPNHFHAILEIVGATPVVARDGVLGGNGENGQPQEIAPTGNGGNGQPQGIAPTLGDMDISLSLRITISPLFISPA